MPERDGLLFPRRCPAAAGTLAQTHNAKRPHSALDDRTPNEFVIVWEKGRFALSNVNKSVASPRQSFLDGALTRGPDPAAQPPKPLAMRAKLSWRIRPIVRVLCLIELL
jgi:hypothetical protein